MSPCRWISHTSAYRDRCRVWGIAAPVQLWRSFYNRRLEILSHIWQCLKFHKQIGSALNMSLCSCVYGPKLKLFWDSVLPEFTVGLLQRSEHPPSLTCPDTAARFLPNTSRTMWTRVVITPLASRSFQNSFEPLEVCLKSLKPCVPPLWGKCCLFWSTLGSFLVFLKCCTKNVEVLFSRREIIPEKNEKQQPNGQQIKIGNKMQ